MQRYPIDLVISDDVIPFLSARFGGDLLPASILPIRELISRFLMNIKNQLPENYKLTVFDASDLASLIGVESKKSSLPIISLDDINLRWARHYCRATTLVDEAGDIIWISKSNKDIQGEVASLRMLGEVAIADLGAQSGTLLSWCVDNMMVKECFLGICGRRARLRLENTDVTLQCLYYFNQLQWVELKDLLGLDGRRCMFNGRIWKLSAISTFIENSHLSEANRETLRNLCLTARAELMSLLYSRQKDTTLFDDVILNIE